MSERGRLSRFHVIALNLALVGLPFAIYFLVYVDAQRARIATREFQTLHDVGTELSGQLLSVNSFLAGNPFDSRHKADDKKLEQLRGTPSFENLRLTGAATSKDKKSPVEFSVDRGRGRVMLEISGPRFQWRPVRAEVGVGTASLPLEDLVEGGRALQFFDALLIADSTGRVVHQQGTGAVHLEDVSDLAERVRASRAGKGAEAKAEKGIAPDPLRSGGMGEPFLEKLALGDVEYWVFGQPWRPPFSERAAASGAGAAHTWTIVGLARPGRFNREVMGVRRTVLAAVVAGLLLGILSWPWLKLWLISSREKLRVVDAQLVALTLLLGAMLTTLALLGAVSYRVAHGKLDRLQERLATRIDEGLRAEISEARSALESFPRRLGKENAVQAARPVAGMALPSFEAAFVANDRGVTAARRSIGLRPAPPVDSWVGDRSYFKLAMKTPDGSMFVERLRSKVTGDKVTLFARNTSGLRGAPAGAAVVALARPLVTLQHAVLPDRFGYAVVNRHSHEVLFHSDERRSLLENLRAAVHNDDGVQVALAHPLRRFVDADYDGRPNRLLSAPAPGGEDGWSLVVFREKALLDDVLSETLITTLPSLLLYLLLLIAATALGRAVLGRDAFWTWVWPRRGYEWRYLGLALALVALAAITVLGIGDLVGRPEAPWPETLALLLAPPAFATSLGFLVLADGRGARRRGLILAGVTLAFAAVATAYVALAIGRADEGANDLVWVLAGLLALLACAALGAPRNSPSGPWMRRWAFLAVAPLGLLITAVLPTAVAFRDAQILVLDSLRAHEGSSVRKRVEERENELRRILGRLDESALESLGLGNGKSLRGATDFERGVLVADPPAAGSDTSRLARQLRKSLPGKRPIPRTPSDRALAPGSAQPLRVAEWLAAGSWWRPSGAGERLALGFGLLAALGTGALLTLSAARRILGLEVPEEPSHRKPVAVSLWVKRWAEESPKPGCRLLVEPGTAFLRSLREELTERERGVAWIELPLPTEECGDPAAALERRLGPLARLVVVVGLETMILEPGCRRALLEFLERTTGGRGLPVLIATAAFSLRQLVLPEPLAEDAHRPESDELQRWSRLLAGFRKEPMGRALDPKRLGALSREVLRQECGDSEEIFEIAAALDAEGIEEGTSDEAIVADLAERAEAHYRRLWSLCSREERLVLIHLARGNLVNPRNVDVIEQLLQRRLVRRNPGFQLMNRSFERFASRAEPHAVVEKWEHETSPSLWLALRSSFLVVLALGGVFVAYLGLETLNPLLALVPVFAGVLPGLSRVASALSAGKPDPSGMA